MELEERSRQRREEIDSILERKPGVREVQDDEDRFTVVGAASRETYANWLTPIEEHFVCHRNPIPEAGESWSVSLSGDLDGELSMTELRDLPTVAVAHTMECAGNGRGQHDPQTGDVQWGYEAAATAVWTGTPVSSVLRARGLDSDDEKRWLTAIGGDPAVDGDIYVRSISLSKALSDCILAYGMNGQPLPEEHGAPVRLLVPGWYGANSVKWVSELRVMDGMVTEGSLDRPETHARWQQEAYRFYPAGDTPEPNKSIDEFDTWEQLRSERIEHPYAFDQNVMSVIGSPTGEEPIDSGKTEIHGVAWAGDDAIERVEISTDVRKSFALSSQSEARGASDDGGETWEEAELFGPEYSCAWRLFRYMWDAPEGIHTLVSRATDEHGRVQPARISDPKEFAEALENGEYPWNGGGYGANAYLPNAVEVEVK